MASTYTSASVASTVPYREHLGLSYVHATYELTAALVINDVIQMVKIPAGATVHEVQLSCDDLDTSGTPACVLAVGDGSDVDRFITASDIGQAGGFARMNNIAGVGYEYTADDTIDVKVTTAPATSAETGTINLFVLYSTGNRTA